MVVPPPSEGQLQGDLGEGGKCPFLPQFRLTHGAENRKKTPTDVTTIRVVPPYDRHHHYRHQQRKRKQRKESPLTRTSGLILQFGETSGQPERGVGILPSGHGAGTA